MPVLVSAHVVELVRTTRLIGGVGVASKRLVSLLMRYSAIVALATQPSRIRRGRSNKNKTTMAAGCREVGEGWEKASSCEANMRSFTRLDIFFSHILQSSFDVMPVIDSETICRKRMRRGRGG
eukprot:548078-Hanusia_phi.AAC.1